MPQSETPAKKTRLPSGLPPYLASLYEVPLLTREQEGHLFRKFNYLKYKAAKLRGQLDPAQAKSSLMDQIEGLYEDVIALKNQIVRANLRLVVSIAKRHVAQADNFFELVSDGNMSLMRAVEKFDFARGNKFSTYASWAIMKNFARTIPDEHRHRDRFRTSHSDMFYSTEEPRTDQYEQESAQSQRESQVGKILERLDEREQKIIISRFGLDHGHEPQTLKEVGAQMGVTKERVRQLEARALTKLRVAAHEEKIDVPGPN
jgi:RNA polymerase primary sigma factor/RNA polymerase sigma factor